MIPSSDRYHLRRLACVPLLPPAGPDAPNDDLAATLGQLSPSARATLPALLRDQGLAALWQPLLRARPGLADAVPDLAPVCAASATAAAGAYLLQCHTARAAEQALTAAGIAHCRIKGAHLRELLYPAPYQRPADDVDLLIAPEQRRAAIAALQATGFDYRPDPRNLTHEATLSRHGAAIDLHWEVMRPARLRTPLGADLLASRRWFATEPDRGGARPASGPVDAQANGHWGPADDLHLLLLLTHPVFTKYATAPQARVVRAVDLAWWLATRPPDWAVVIDRLRQSGLAVAAWVTLQWLWHVTGIGVPSAVSADLAPGRLRRGYLAAWVRHDLATRLRATPALIQVGFTLPAQDRATDAWRMLRAPRAIAPGADAPK